MGWGSGRDQSCGCKNRLSISVVYSRFDFSCRDAFQCAWVGQLRARSGWVSRPNPLPPFSYATPLLSSSLFVSLSILEDPSSCGVMFCMAVIPCGRSLGCRH